MVLVVSTGSLPIPLILPQRMAKCLTVEKKLGVSHAFQLYLITFFLYKSIVPVTFFSTVKHSAILSGSAWGMSTKHPDTVYTSNSASKMVLAILGSIHKVITLFLQGEFGIGPQTRNPTS